MTDAQLHLLDRFVTGAHDGDALNRFGHALSPLGVIAPSTASRRGSARHRKSQSSTRISVDALVSDRRQATRLTLVARIVARGCRKALNGRRPVLIMVTPVRTSPGRWGVARGLPEAPAQVRLVREAAPQRNVTHGRIGRKHVLSGQFHTRTAKECGDSPNVRFKEREKCASLR